MATIFGSAGAGLAGYKMMRRTRGLQEFEFETHGESNKFALLIAVSGWLEEPEDYKRAFGVLPAHLPDRERLVRFYELHAPQRLLKVDMEVQEFADHFDDLYHQLAELYGKDPRDNEQLLPRAELDVFPGTAEAVGGFLAEIDESARSSSLLSAFTSSSSRRDRNKKTGADSLSCLTSLRSRGALGDEDGGESAASYWNWAELRESAAYELCLLRWETQLQREMGDSIKELVKSLGSSAVQNILAATVLTAVASAVLWPVFLIQLTSVIDNSWVLAIETADAAGKELAQAILNRSNGTRPITLVGYSFGARVVYSCLRELALQTGELSAADFDLDEDNFRRAAPESAQEPRDDDDEDEPALPQQQQQQQPAQQSAQPSERSFFGFSSSRSAASAGEKDEKAANRLTALEVKAVIQDVVLLGAPVSANSRAWPAIRNLVAGRIVNGYSQRDLVLGLIYRYQRFHLSVCGVTPIEGVAGVENLDLSELIERHTDYGRRMHQILETVGLSSAREISPVPPT